MENQSWCSQLYSLEAAERANRDAEQVLPIASIEIFYEEGSTGGAHNFTFLSTLAVAKTTDFLSPAFNRREENGTC